MSGAEIDRYEEREIFAYGVAPEVLARSSDIKKLARQMAKDRYPELTPDTRINIRPGSLRDFSVCYPQNGGVPLWVKFLVSATETWDARHD